MTLSYVDEVAERLRNWRDADSVLYQAAERTLESIKSNPTGFGADGQPFFDRLVTFSVRGRSDEYVVTWENKAGETAILSISSALELDQRARLQP